MQAVNPFRNRPVRSGPVIVALVVAAACFSFASSLHAQQTDQEATAILTRYSWYFDPNHPQHLVAFSPDGTFIFYRPGASGNLVAIKAYSGKWTISNATVTMINNDGDQCILKPPIDPDLTHAIGSSGPIIVKRTLVTPPPEPSSQAHRIAAETQPLATPPPYVPPETQQQASAVMQAHHDSILFTSSAAGAGGGFVAAMNGGNFLVTDTRAIAALRDGAFKTLDGTAVDGGVPSMAVGEDIFCMSMPSGGTPFDIMQQVDANAAVGDDVVVLGNTQGGVVNTIIGKIVGIGPNLVEVDAPFAAGDSGSPIIHLKSGKVIGVAAYVVSNQYDLTGGETGGQPAIRRLGYRLDTVKGWEQVDWRSFNAQAAAMTRIETVTSDLYDFFRDLQQNKGNIAPGRHTDPLFKNRIDDWIEQKASHPSAEDAAEADATFVSFLKTASQSDIGTMESQPTYDYFRRELGDQKLTRDGIVNAIQQLIQGPGQ